MSVSLLRSVAVAASFLVMAGTVSAQSSRTQVISLEAGWNAVYLEVDPPDTKPENIFSALGVDVVATFDASRSGAEFVGDSSINIQNARGWSVWYGPTRPDAFLGSLKTIYGAKAYLVHAASNVQWVVEGAIAPVKQEWVPDAFNFVGFPVVALGAPTYEAFFTASPAHNHNRIYRLVNGVWQQVLDPGGVQMTAGEAFWIFCDGHSRYPGPVAVSTPSHLGLVLSEASGSELVLRNQTAYPVDLTLSHDAGSSEGIALAMPFLGFDEEAKATREVLMDLGTGSWTQDLPTLGAGASMRIPLQLKMQDMAPGEYHSVLTVTSDIGTLQHVAVTASREL